MKTFTKKIPSLLTQNSKLKKTSKKTGLRVFNFGITAYKTSKGKITCPFADKCIKFCYARKGAYIWSNVAKVFEQRYDFSKTDQFVDAMSKDIKRKKADFIRVHDSGDYYSLTYLKKWLKIANLHPSVKFYSYTNSIAMIKRAQKENLIPKNYDFIFSNSGKQIELINKKLDRYTDIFDNEIKLIENDFINASEIDINATKFVNPNNNKIGLIFH